MYSNLLKQWLNIFIIALILTFVVSCTDDEDSGTGPDTTVKTAPSVMIISPSADTTVASDVDTVIVTAMYLDLDTVGVDSVFIGGLGNTTDSLDSDTFSIEVALTTDTTIVIAKILASDGTTDMDTITIYKEASDITQGLSRISGVLLKDASTRKLGFIPTNRVAQNAQGTKRQVSGVLPITGADVLLYNSESFSTSSDTVVKTDSTGNWSVDIDPGNYYVFAVYFDMENLELVTASLPDIKAEADKETKTDSTTAINDDIDPYVKAFLDAAESNDDNLFIASDIPQNMPIVIVFSEPMNRTSAGDSLSGIVLGPVDEDSSSLPLTDTIAVQKLWGPNGKELRLIPADTLKVGTTYKVVIPSSSKDLALNKLDAAYSGIFGVTEAVKLVAFELKNTSPATGDTISIVTPIEFIFTRPVDMLSLNKNYTLTSATDTSRALEGYFEGLGRVAKFIPKQKWLNSTTYTITLGAALKDLLGDSLGTAAALTFTTKAKDTLENKVGTEGQVAAIVNGFMGAYIAGDIETFGQAFHAKFEIIESHDGEESRLQKEEFLQERRDDIEMRERMAKYGFLAPKFYMINGSPCWKLVKDTLVAYVQDNFGAFGEEQKVFGSDSSDITSSITWVNRGILVNGDTLIMHPDMSKAFVDEETQENDPGFFGKLLQEETHVEVQEIFAELKDDFLIKAIEAADTVDSAKVMMEIISTESFKDNKYPFPVDPNNPPEPQKHVMAIQIKLIKDGSQWYVIQMVAKELYSGNNDDFNPDSINQDDFIIGDFQQTQSIEFISPTQKAVGVTAPITFAWTAPADSNVGGYIVAISDEMSGGNSGLLLFTNDTTLSVSATGQVTGGSIINKDPMSFNVPLPHFSTSLTSLSVADSAIYVWKVVAIPESSKADIVANQLKVIADSDFGSHGGIGIFTMLAEMPDISQDFDNFDPNKNGDNHFSDMDGDYFPDWIENAFGTNPNNSGEYPNFKIDTDKDGFADFLEIGAATDPEDDTSVPADTNNNKIPDTYEVSPGWDPMLSKDDDNDGFPNEIEHVYGTDPWDPNSVPSTTVKPLAPTGKYYGMLFFEGSESDSSKGGAKIQITITSDENGDFAIIDSANLPGLPKDGIGIQTSLKFEFGEWVFYIPIESGVNVGKFIKIRFHEQSNYIEGPVDLADMNPGGGPFIGRFVASEDPNFDFENFIPDDGNIIEDPKDSTINIGPANPQDLIRPDSNSFDLSLSMVFDSIKGPSATLTADGKVMQSDGIFWDPRQNPALHFNFSDSTGHYQFSGNLHRNGDKQSGNDSLVLVGNYRIELSDSMRMHVVYDYASTLILTSYGSEWMPSGTWSGWYAKHEGIINEGPFAFIGDSIKVVEALALTNNKAVIHDVNKDSIITITSFESFKPDSNMQHGIWVAIADNSKFEILEMPGDYQNVWVQDMGNEKVIVLRSMGGGIDGPNVNPYMGDSASVVAALGTSGDTVSVPDSIPGQFIDILVDPSTLYKMYNPEDSTEYAWIIKPVHAPEKEVVFEGTLDDLMVMALNGNKPIVFPKDMMMIRRKD